MGWKSILLVVFILGIFLVGTISIMQEKSAQVVKQETTTTWKIPETKTFFVTKTKTSLGAKVLEEDLS